MPGSVEPLPTNQTEFMHLLSAHDGDSVILILQMEQLKCYYVSSLFSSYMHNSSHAHSQGRCVSVDLVAILAKTHSYST